MLKLIIVSIVVSAGCLNSPTDSVERSEELLSVYVDTTCGNGVYLALDKLGHALVSELSFEYGNTKTSTAGTGNLIPATNWLSILTVGNSTTVILDDFAIKIWPIGCGSGIVTAFKTGSEVAVTWQFD